MLYTVQRFEAFSILKQIPKSLPQNWREQCWKPIKGSILVCFENWLKIVLIIQKKHTHIYTYSLYIAWTAITVEIGIPF